MQFNGPQSHILFVGNLWGPCIIGCESREGNQGKVRLPTKVTNAMVSIGKQLSQPQGGSNIFSINSIE